MFKEKDIVFVEDNNERYKAVIEKVNSKDDILVSDGQHFYTVAESNLFSADTSKYGFHDSVNHPSHYTDGKIEVIDFINDKKLNFNRGNVIKYVARAGKKASGSLDLGKKEVEDLEKAAFYLEDEIKRLDPNPNRKKVKVKAIKDSLYKYQEEFCRSKMGFTTLKHTSYYEGATAALRAILQDTLNDEEFADVTNMLEQIEAQVYSKTVHEKQ